MSAANLKCFSEPHWRVIARGLDTESWFNEGHGVGSGGIVMPKVEDLFVGHRYYRFASSTASRHSQIGGGWWVDFENFRKIEVFSQTNAIDLTYAARLFLALPIEWTRVDRLVSAFLKIPLRAYAGRGKVAEVGGERWTPMQHVHVKQLYIPGLYRKGEASQLYQEAFPEPKIEFVATRKELR